MVHKKCGWRNFIPTISIIKWLPYYQIDNCNDLGKMLWKPSQLRYGLVIVVWMNHTYSRNSSYYCQSSLHSCYIWIWYNIFYKRGQQILILKILLNVRRIVKQMLGSIILGLDQVKVIKLKFSSTQMVIWLDLTTNIACLSSASVLISYAQVI